MGNFIIVADDITGACDTGAYLCLYEDNIKVLIDSSDLPSTRIQSPGRALVCNTHTRTISPENAYDKVYKIGVHLRDIKDKTILKKIDTGYRGNVAFELNALMDSLDIELCFVVNSIPAIDTITVGGYQIIMGKLLEKSGFAADPVNCVKQSFVPDILMENSRREVGLITLKSVRGKEIENHITEQIKENKRILVFDTASEDDIRTILKSLYKKYNNALWTGSLGLVKCLSEAFFEKQEKKRVHDTEESMKKGAVGFTASTHPVTDTQIKKAEAEGFIEVIYADMNRLLDKKGSKAELERIYNEFDSRIKTGNVVIKTTRVENVRYANIEKIIPRFLNIIAKEICSREGIGKIILIGGDTGYNILNALEVGTIELKDRIEQAIACGVIQDGRLAGWQVAIKGGSAGSEDALIKMLKY